MTRLAGLTCMMLPLLATSCRGGVGTDPVQRRQADLDFATGHVQGTILWNGTPIDPQNLDGGFIANDPNGAGFWIFSSNYSAVNLQTGDRTLTLHGGNCSDAQSSLGEAHFTITAGSTTTADFDLTTTAGQLRGSVATNGASVPGAWIAIDSQTQCRIGVSHTFQYGTNLHGFPTNGSGSFARLIAPGVYTASVYGPSGRIGSRTFTIVAGQTTDVGVIDISTGDLQWTVSWGGAAAGTQETNGLLVSEPDGPSFWLFGAAGTARSVSSGPHTLSLFANSCTDATNKLGEASVTVPAGATASTDIDVSSTAGRVTGSIAMNGVALSNALIAIDPQCANLEFSYTHDDGTQYTSLYPTGSPEVISPGFPVGLDGTFARLLAPGTYIATILDSTGRIHSFPFNVLAGQTTDVGTVDIQVGGVQGTATWYGRPLNALESTGPRLHLAGPGGLSSWLDGSSYSVATLSPGLHTLGLYTGTCTDPSARIGQTTFTVNVGTTTTAGIELKDTAGRITGAITGNGTPLQTFINIAGTCMSFNSDETGRFSRILPPGAYDAMVYGSGAESGGQVGAFNFNILAGQTTSVDSVTTPGCMPPACASVRTDLEGGIAQVGGLSLEFLQVMTAGNTTLVESGSCAPTCAQLPTGFELVGARYWDLSTTASYSGPIEVCIHYDQAWVGGECPSPPPADGSIPECGLRLVHDGGAGFKNITGTLDTANNIICGSTTSLSPFAIVAAEPAANTPPVVIVPSNMIVEATGPGGAVVTFAATASDAQDPGLALSCSRSAGSTFALGTTAVTCTATDSGGLSGSASFTITVRDTTPPIFGRFADTLSAYATSTRGAIVNYTAPTAIDAVNGARPVTCQRAPGSQFAIGKTTVTCSTSDTSGNPNTAAFTVWVTYQAPTDGTFFLSPIRANGSSIFLTGRAVPVKFKLTGASAGITNLSARLVVTRISNSIQGTVNDVGDEDGEDTDFLFKYRPAKRIYGYRWKTRGETQGAYQLRADLGDGVAHLITVSLKAAR